MNIQSIYLGASANDNTGNTLRQGGFKINDNFNELFTFSSTRHRQSLLLYKTLSGSPSFLQDSGLCIDLITPILGTIGAGVEQRGERNRSIVINSDVLSAWTLPDNDISYLYIEQNSLSGSPIFGYSLIEPVKSQTPPTAVSGQHWFDSLNNQMYEYNGTTYDYVNRLFIAEVVTLGGIVVDTIYYTSNDESEYVDVSVLSAISACNEYTNVLVLSSVGYTTSAFNSSINYTDLKTAANLISSNTYSDNSAKKYALVFG